MGEKTARPGNGRADLTRLLPPFSPASRGGLVSRGGATTTSSDHTPPTTLTAIGLDLSSSLTSGVAPSVESVPGSVPGLPVQAGGGLTLVPSYGELLRANPGSSAALSR